MLPTIGAFLTLRPADFAGQPSRSTDSRVPLILEGERESDVGDAHITSRAGDEIGVPDWTPVVHRAASWSFVFAASVIPPQQRLGLWRAHTNIWGEP